MKKDIKTFCPKSRADWRNWLDKNHHSEQAVWLVFYTKSSGKDTVSWGDAVDVSLCYGWIDSKKQKIDAISYRQFYSKRKEKSTWSKINKEKVKYLIETKKMKPAGYRVIEIAKQNGSWILFDDAENLIIPHDFEIALKQEEGAMAYFLSLSRSTRKSMLHWIVLARKNETRQKRILEISELAAQNQKPKQFR